MVQQDLRKAITDLRGPAPPSIRYHRPLISRARQADRDGRGMTANRLTGLMAACAFSVFMSACGGGGDKAPTDPLAYPVSHRESTYIDADPRTPARIAFDHLSFAARTAAMPWGWLPVSAPTYTCASASDSMSVTLHANYTAEQPVAEYTLIDSNACSFTPFQNFSGYWRGDTPYSVNWASPLLDATVYGSAAIAFDVVRGNVKRQSLVLGALSYVVHKDASSLTVDVTTPYSITQDQTAVTPYPQLQISALALHLDNVPTGDLLGSVSGHFTSRGRGTTSGINFASSVRQRVASFVFPSASLRRLAVQQVSAELRASVRAWARGPQRAWVPASVRFSAQVWARASS